MELRIIDTVTHHLQRGSVNGLLIHRKQYIAVLQDTLLHLIVTGTARNL